MRIVFILNDTQLGGTERASLRLMQCLKQQGHALQVISLTPAGSMQALLDAEAIPCTDMPRAGKGGWRNLPRLIRAIRAARADAAILAHHNPIAALACAWARVPVRVQVIHHFHRGLKSDLEWKLIYLLSLLCEHHLVFVCAFVRDEAVGILNLVDRRSSVVHNIAPGVRQISQAERQRARSSFGLPADCKVVGSAGRHVAGKRFDVFLEVAAKVTARDPRAHFLIAGSGPLTESLKARSRELGIADRVHWLSWLESMDDFYASLDVLLFNSDIDALGLMAIEAMACGIPVVASVVAGGMRELIESDAEGFLLDAHDVELLTEKVLICLGPAGARVGAAGQIRSQRYGAAADVAGRMTRILEQAASPRGFR